MSEQSRKANKESGLLVLIGLGSVVASLLILAVYVLAMSWFKGLPF